MGADRNWNRHMKGKDDDCLVICKTSKKPTSKKTQNLPKQKKKKFFSGSRMHGLRIEALWGYLPTRAWSEKAFQKVNFSCLYFNSDLSPFLGVKIITQQVQPSKILPKPVTATLPSSSNSPIMVVSSNGTIMTTKLVTTPTGKLWLWEGKGG